MKRMHLQLLKKANCVLAMYKINTNLERLGDFAESIARFAGNLPEGEPIDPQLVKETRVCLLYTSRCV